MSVKRALFTCLVCVLVTNMLTVSAFAHGGCHGRGGCYGRRTQVQQTVVHVCEVEGCTVAGRHVHDGVVYCGYDHEGGYCNGSCLALCPVEGCTVAGRHVHDGVVYCGNDHSCGFCDGTCAAHFYQSWHH